MKKYSLLFVFLICVAGAEAQSAAHAQDGQKRLHGSGPSPNRILVTAHRGDWRDEPENSLRAFVAAADLGVDIVELDLNKSKDGEIVIMHDGTGSDDSTEGPAGHGEPGQKLSLLYRGICYIKRNRDFAAGYF